MLQKDNEYPYWHYNVDMRKADAVEGMDGN